MYFIEKLNQSITIKRVSLLALVLNVISIISGIIYIVIPVYSIFWDIFGVILLITLFNNLLLAYLNAKKLNKSNELGKKLNLLNYVYLAYVMIAMLGMMEANLLISITYSNDIAILTGMLYFWYFSVFSFSLIICFINIAKIGDNNLWIDGDRSSSKKNQPKTLLKRLLTITSSFLFLGGMYLSLTIAFGRYFDIIVLPTILSGQFAIFFSVNLVSNAIILIKLKGKQIGDKFNKRIGFIAVIGAGLLLAPLFATPYAYTTGDSNFSQAFGNDWKSKIDSTIEQQYFLKTPFSTPEFFLGIMPEDCQVIQDEKFYDDGINQLYFDAYYPNEDPSTLPGKGSTLIRIHGGGWVVGAKGAGNMLQMNKYFAAQGYIVYDIEYFMREIRFETPFNPAYRTGDFIMDDIVASLGYFTSFIAANAKNFGNPDLDSVFISGGSAGGHLTTALGLGISSGLYDDLFGTALTIKGLIPYYPANGQGKWFGLTGDPDLINSENLVDENSPPCLIFQGTHDILNWFNVAEGIKLKYDQQGTGNCAIIWLPSGGHACDIYYSGYYNQVFLYYYERFMYLCVNDLI